MSTSDRSFGRGPTARVHVRQSLVALLIVGAAALVAPRHAAATPNFPAALAGDLGLEVVPPCTDCHQTLRGGLGTVTKPFGKYMRSRGLVEYNEASLKNALAALQGEAAGGVEHPVRFLAALRAGTDPNDGIAADEEPIYGCGAQVSRRASGQGGVAAAMVVAAVGIVLKRRRGATA